MNRRIFCLALVAGLIAPAALLARDPAPAAGAADVAASSQWRLVALLAIESYDATLQDVDALGDITENPTLTAPSLEGWINLFTQGKGLNGLDRKRPWGAVAYTNGSEFRTIGFLPVVSLKKLLASVGHLLGGEIKEADGMIQIVQPDRTIYLKEAGGWAFFAASADDLKSAPADPGVFAAPLTKSYDIALQVKVKNIPEALRESLIVLFRGELDRGLKRQPGDDKEYEDRAKLMEARIAAITEAINSADLFTLGWVIDESAKTAALEVKVAAIPGSPLAQSFTLNADAVSSLTGLLSPDAAITAGIVGKLSEDERAEQASQVDVARDALIDKIEDWIADESLEDATSELVEELAANVKKTIASGKRDIAASVLLDETMTMVAGAYVADPLAVEKAFKKFAKAVAKSYPTAPQPKFDADKTGDVRFHTVVIPLDKDDAIDLFGPQLDVVLGIGPQNVYFAFGKQGLADLKKNVGKPASVGKKAAPGQLTVSVIPVVAFLADVIDDDNPNKQSLERLAKFADTLGDKDNILVRTTPENSQLTFRVEIEKDAIRVGAAAIELSRGAKKLGKK